MITLTVELSLVPVDMGAKQEIPVVNLAIKNSKGTINVVGPLKVKTVMEKS